eukprot:6115882-Alexandrium_andersonii.AAC.1
MGDESPRPVDSGDASRPSTQARAGVPPTASGSAPRARTAKRDPSGQPTKQPDGETQAVCPST